MNVLKKISSVLAGGHKLRIIILFFMTIFLTLIEIISIGSIPILISTVISGDIEFMGLSKLNDLLKEISFIFLSLSVIFIFIIKNIFILLYNYFSAHLNYRIHTFLSKKIFREYLYSDYLVLSKVKTSDIIRNLTTEVGGFVSCISNFIALFRDAFLLISILILIISVLDLKFFIIFIVFLLITAIFYILIKNFLNKIGKETVFLRSKYLETISDSFKLVKEIIVNAKRNYFIEKFFKNLKVAEKNNLKSFFIFSSGKAVFEVIAVIMMILMIIFLNNEKYEISFIISYLSLIGVSVIRSMPVFNSVLTSLNKLQYKKPSIDVIINLLEFTKNNKLKSITSDETKQNNNQNINFKKRIKIKNLTFKYDNAKILNSLNLEIYKGEKIALVGESGSGKTTLMNILSGIIKLDNHELSVDDITITNKDYVTYRKLVSLMPQESYLMNETIENNIIFGDELNFNKFKLHQLLNIVNAEKFINKLENKEKEIIREDGSNISGGEKQRLVFARSLYKNFELLILDEPTSSLDKENSSNIINKILRDYSDKTILIVTHKIDIDVKFDRILRIDQGKIIEIQN